MPINLLPQKVSFLLHRIHDILDMSEMSVCPSVRLSVKHVNCDKT